jgi:hypothetical protein
MIEGSLDRFDRRAVSFLEMRGDDCTADPAPHMGKQSLGNGRRWLPFVAGSAADGQPIEYALIEIDERVTKVPLG